MRTNNTLMYVMLAGGLISLLMSIGRLPGWILTPLIICVAALGGLYYVTKHKKELLLELYVLPRGKQLVERWCNLVGEQSPLQRTAGSLQSFKLDTAVQQQEAIDYCSRFCRGYDEMASRIVHHLAEQLILRKSRNQVMSSHPPLGAYMVVGPESSGKTYFLRVLSKAVLGEEDAVVIDLGQWSADACSTLLGKEGLIVQAVKRNPDCIFVLERSELMPETLQRSLSTLLRQGCLIDEGGRSISFSNCVFFFTTTRLFESLSVDQVESHSRAQSRINAIELLAADGGLDRDLLSRLTDVFVMKPFTTLQQAEVVALQLTKECASHGIHLKFIDAEVIASQVNLLTEEVGFSQLQDRVRDFLRQPLVHAATRQASTLSITLEPVE